MSLDLASDVQLDTWLSIVGLIVSVPPLIVFFFNLGARVKRASPRIAMHEFVLLIRQPWHIALTLVMLGGATYLIVAIQLSGDLVGAV